MTSIENTLLLCLIYSVLWKSATCIDCYQCSGTDSEHPFECNEYLDNSSDLEPTDCASIHNAQFCIKHVGRYEGGISTKRFCSSLDLGNYCHYVQQPGDKLEYRTCIYSCSADGCNVARALSPSFVTTVSVVGVAVASLVLRRLM